MVMDDRTQRGTVILGHCWTRGEAARAAGISPGDLQHHPGVLRLAGHFSLEEVYPAFQFQHEGIDARVAQLIERLLAVMDAWSATDWLTRPQARLGGESPAGWVSAGRGFAGLEHPMSDLPLAA